ncbi:MAG: WHG domain-containing protein [Anaerolineales bacterium]|jgi:AcrR family transcriptional regulator
MSPRANLSKQTVVQAAADLINAEGLEALSLGRLAKELGIRTPSLYNHVDGLPGLMRDLSILNAHNLADRISGAAIGQSGAEAVMAIMQAMRTYIKECPGLYMSTVRAAGTHPEANPELEQEEKRSVKVGMAVMASFGLEEEKAIHALRGLRSLVHGFATLEISGGFGIPLDLDESFSRLVDLFISGLEQQSKHIMEMGRWKRSKG